MASSIPIDSDGSGTWDWPLQHNDGVVKVTNTAEKFEVGLDVQFFTPNEIEVRYCTTEITHTISTGEGSGKRDSDQLPS